MRVAELVYAGDHLMIPGKMKKLRDSWACVYGMPTMGGIISNDELAYARSGYATSLYRLCVGHYF